MEYLVTFHTHSGAIRYRKYLRKHKLELRLKPVPRKISSNCGVSGVIQTDINLLEHTESGIEGIYEVSGKDYKQIYKND